MRDNPRQVRHVAGGAAHRVIPYRRALIVVKSGGISFIDSGDPLALREMALVPSLGTGALCLEGDRLCFTDSLGFRVFDISDANHPVEVGRLSLEGQATACLVRHDTAYVFLRRRGLAVIALETLGPRLIDVLEIGGSVMDLSAQGEILFLADVSGVKAMSLAQPRRPFLVGRTGLPGWPKDVWISGNRALVADVVGLRILDLSRPGPPQTLARLAQPGWRTARLCLEGHIIYIADESAGLRMIRNELNGVKPALLSTLEVTGGCWDVAVEGGRAVLACGSGGVVLADVTDPERPTMLASLDVPGDCLGVFMEGGLAFVAAGRAGLAVVGDYSSPRIQALVPALDTAWDVAPAQDALYLADGKAGLAVISRPDMKLIKHVPAGEARGLFLQGSELFVACGEDGLRVFDISQAQTPRLASHQPLDGFARNVFVRGPVACVALGDGGLAILGEKERP